MSVPAVWVPPGALWWSGAQCVNVSKGLSGSSPQLLIPLQLMLNQICND